MPLFECRRSHLASFMDLELLAGHVVFPHNIGRYTSQLNTRRLNTQAVLARRSGH